MFKLNSLVTAYATEQEKRKLWNIGVADGVYAIDENGKKYKLKEIPFECVDFIDGVWRVQMFKCNRLVTAYKTEQEKRKLWDCGVVGGVYAIDCENKQYKLIDLPFERVDFIAGLWRVQRDFDEKIQIVRGKEFILLNKIDKQEKNLFEYYTAATVGNNCYGLYSSMDPDCVVAKYDTDNGPLWAYGSTLEQARAFLGIALFDKNIDLIHAAERKTFHKSK